MIVDNEKALPGAAKALLEAHPGHRVFAFFGAMGAGKTTFIRALCREMGVMDTVQSPTFAIINEYRKPNGEPVFHFDFYRIRKREEVFDIGYEDYLYSGAICLIEWPELIEDLLPPEAVRVMITGTKERLISWD